MIKKSLLIICIGIFTILSCSKTPDLSPHEEMSIPTSGIHSDKVLIKLKPKVGEIQKMMMDVIVESGSNQDLSMNMQINMDLTVTNKEGIIYTYDLKYQSIKMDVNTGGIGFAFDSDSENQNGMGAIIKQQLDPIIEKPWQLRMDESGQLIDFNIDKSANTPELGDIGSISIPLPEEPVGMGDAWTAERSMEDLGMMKMNMKIEKITVDDVTISTQGELVNDSGIAIGQLSGNYKLNRHNGFTKDATLSILVDEENQPMKIKMNFKGI